MPHAGHARAALLPTCSCAACAQLGQRVTYVRNITDVDDKILARAQKNGEDPLDLSRRMAVVYQSEMRAVGCLAPDHEPRVSDHLREIVALIEKLVERGSAYVVDMPGGKRDVYFAVRSFAGLRQALAPQHRRPRRRRARRASARTSATRSISRCGRAPDADEWGWESPWGRGRPGLAHRVLGDVRRATSGTASTCTRAAWT